MRLAGTVDTNLRAAWTASALRPSMVKEADKKWMLWRA